MITIKTGNGTSVELTGEWELTKKGTTPDPVDPDPDPPPVVTDPPTIPEGFKVGVCGFPWFPMSLLAGIGMKWERVYVASGWIWQPGGLSAQPMHQGETAENRGIDALLLKAQAHGVNVLLTIHQTPEWYRNTGRDDGNNNFAPVKAGANRSDPASYKDYADFLFQVAARYGWVAHPPEALKVSTKPRWENDIINEPKTGLKLLKFIEPWNETDKWWLKGTEAYFEPEETAALMAACYDAIKRADPSMVVVMPGITDLDMSYMAAMDAWFKAHRPEGKWPCDIINVHHYSNRGNKKGQYPAQWVASGACLPAEDANFVTIREVVDFAESMGKKTWVTEFGADKMPPSGMHAKGVGKSDERYQSEIIMESIKAYKLAGVDGVFIFNAPDENGAVDGGQFESCGIFSSEATGYKPFIVASALTAYLAPKTLSLKGVGTKLLTKASDGKRPNGV